MPSQSRKYRGYASQSTVAAYLAANGWPFAQSTGAGRSGTDITGTPGLCIRVISLVDDSKEEGLAE